MKVSLTNYTPEPEKSIVEAAAACWKSVPHEGILHHIIKAGHWTPLEFVSFNFCVEGVSRALTHQLVRKRVGVAFAQESQRWCKYEDGFEYVLPQSILNCEQNHMSGNARNLFEKAMLNASSNYKELLNMGIPPEDARFVLPNACISTIYIAINYHALVDLAKERLCTRAQWEIRELLEQIKQKVETVSPILAGYLQPKCYWIGQCPEQNPCLRNRQKAHS